MTLIWTVLAILVFVVGLKTRRRLDARRHTGAPTVDDAAIQRILHEGQLSSAEEEDEPLDREAAAEAEEDFWSEYWDEPDEYER